ncbi:molybdate ABC transporter substrate-binding protein [Nocardioides perillae]|uniref:Molybdate transport system substrate-binding protein n=1 Tax=Nocardioides perillae TaxID=1119534 RepID=A0A7Y9UNR8_9ACTN|nr:molybdate transport system substrate-binding protein [Nocardioides perillae]
MALTLGAALLAACSGGDEQVLTVVAPASAGEVFATLAEEFEEQEGVEVRLSVAGSADLVAQVQQGAPVDVVATADEAAMAGLVEDALVGGARVFATNSLALAVPAGNPAGVTGLADVAEGGDARLVTCAPQVPCGALAQQVADAAGVALAPVSEEGAVTDVLGKVTSGEADAGLVYVTDLLEVGEAVEEVPLPEAAALVNRYPVAVATGAPEPELAERFVALLLSADGRRLLGRAGFGTP